MKKTIIFLFFLIINIFLFSSEINEKGEIQTNYIKGTVIFNNFVLLPSNVEISLYNYNYQLININPSIIGNNFYFINLPKNEHYQVIIKYNNIKRSIFFYYEDGNKNLGVTFLEPSYSDFSRNVFYNFILVFAIAISILFLKIFKQKSKLAHENPLVLGVIFYTIADFLVLFSNFIGYTNEILGSKLIFISNIPQKIFYVFILITVIKYIKVDKNIIFKGLCYFFMLWQIISLPSILSFAYPSIFEKLLVMNQFSFNILYGSLLANSFNYILFLLSLLICLAYYLYIKKGQINRLELKSYLIFAFLLLIVEVLSFTSLSEAKVRLFSIYLENFELFALVIIVSLIITNNIGYKYTEKINILQLIMQKIIKYFVLFNIVYNMLGVLEAPYIAYLFMFGFFLSDLLSFVSKKFFGKNTHLINQISSQLLLSNNEKEFEFILVENLSDNKKIKNIKYFFLEKEECIENYVIENRKTKVMKKESFTENYKQYDYLIKTIFNDKLIGFLLIDTNNKILANQTLDFLMALSDSFALIVKTIRINTLKSQIQEDVSDSNLQNYNSIREKLMLNKEFAKLILTNNSKEKIDKFAKEIINQIEEADIDA